MKINKTVWMLTLPLIVITLALKVLTSSDAHPLPLANEQYVCLPCGSDCDNIIVNSPGKCKHCQMKLVKKADVVFSTIAPSAICEYINQHPKTILLDVRTKKEFEGKTFPEFGTLKNAINIPIQELENRLEELTAFKNSEIVVYCSHSQRSPQACYFLTQHGFTNVTNMAGGMSKLKDKSCKN